MDHFGIGGGVEGAALIYFTSARRTGRTTSLIESLKDGDRIVFANQREADRVKRLCLERGLNVSFIVVDPRKVRDIFQYPTSEGRTIFDHSWVEDFYLHAIEACRKDIDYIQREASGYGTAHIETRQRAAELAKWNI